MKNNLPTDFIDNKCFFQFYIAYEISILTLKKGQQLKSYMLVYQRERIYIEERDERKSKEEKASQKCGQYRSKRFLNGAITLKCSLRFYPILKQRIVQIDERKNSQ